MVVKSATKKRLMELGVSEDFAHKLATDRNMDAIKKMTDEEVAKDLGLSIDDEQIISVMGIIREIGTHKRSRRSKKITISARALDDEDLPTDTVRFNVLNHVLAPHQELVPVEDEEEVLSPWGLMQEDYDGTVRLAKELLPKILITDPVIQVIKEKVEAIDAASSAENPDHIPLPAGWLADRVLKIVRPSPSAGFTVAYRLIVESN